jgi:hypothetical protein
MQNFLFDPNGSIAMRAGRGFQLRSMIARTDADQNEETRK